MRLNLEGPEFDEMVNKVYVELRKDTIPVYEGEMDLSDLKCLEVVAPGVPVCGMQFEGMRIHAPGKAERGAIKRGKKIMVTSVQRMWGGGLRPCYALEEVLQHYSPDEVLESAKTILYTRGTPEGFKARVEKQMGMPTKSMRQIFGKQEQTVDSMFKKLDKLFDVPEKMDLPSWDGELGGFNLHGDNLRRCLRRSPIL